MNKNIIYDDVLCQRLSKKTAIVKLVTSKIEETIKKLCDRYENTLRWIFHYFSFFIRLFWMSFRFGDWELRSLVGFLWPQLWPMNWVDRRRWKYDGEKCNLMTIYLFGHFYVNLRHLIEHSAILHSFPWRWKKEEQED
jgi:hypothetical protein